MTIKRILNDPLGGKGTGRHQRAIIKDIEDNFIEVDVRLSSAETALTGIFDEATGAADAASNSAQDANDAANLADEKANNALNSAVIAGVARDGAVNARNEAAVSAASANALNPAISADAGITDRSFLIVDEVGNSVFELSGNAKILKLVAATLSLLVDGSSRVSRPDGLSSIDLRSDGVGLPGVTASLSTLEGVDFALTDESGIFAFLKHLIGGGVWLEGLLVNSSAGITSLSGADGNLILSSRSGGGANIAGSEFYIENRNDIIFGISDANGFLAFAIKTDGTTLAYGIGGYGSSAGSTVYSSDEIAERNARSLALAGQTARKYEADIQRPVFAYNHFISYGQSLSNGWEGWPALSTSAAYSTNLMLGSSVHPNNESGTTWVPVGSATFAPLIATVRDTSNPGGLIDATAQAALVAGASNRGETVLEGALRFLRKASNDARGVADDTARKFVGTACGVGGRTIEALSKGASPEHFNRLRDAATAVKGAAATAGGDYGVPAVLFLQGEYNEDTTNGGVADKATYKAKLKQLVADIRADIQTTIATQSRPFGVFTYQTGASFRRDVGNFGVAMSQLELSEEEQNWYLVAPSYPVTDKGGHLDPNGYRWLGNQFGKVMHRVLVLGQRWRPLCPLQITSRGRQILIDFHVPQPPLVFDTPYVVNSATDYATKGFAVLDSGGNSLSLSAVEIVADSLVRLTLAADAPTGGLTVRYAGQATFSGNGCLRDSDLTIAADNYTYNAGSGQYAAANIANLIAKPYPLSNWCVAFQQSAIAG